MCGLAGALGHDPEASDRVRMMVGLMDCRGPDDRGYWDAPTLSGRVLLGHSRLSVVDPTVASHQPMVSNDATVALTFNGEIYNFRTLRDELANLGWQFRSRGDTEVVLAAYSVWGDGAWSRLDGMFALAVVDLRQCVFKLVRSRFGSKPLAFARHAGTLWFASTADVLARALGLPVDVASLGLGVRTWVYEGSHSSGIFVGVEQVPPGTVLTWSLNGKSEPVRHRWYDLDQAVAQTRLPPNAADAAAAVGRLLAASVTARVVADVEVGVSLSGGLDSCSVAALAAACLDEPLRVYSYRSGPADPEVRDVEALIATLPHGARLTWVEPPRIGRMGAAMEMAMVAQGGPPGGLSVVAQQAVFRSARRHGTTVVLGGQGADEVFMGYGKYRLSHARGLIAQGRLLRALWVGSGLIGSTARNPRGLRESLASASRYAKSRLSVEPGSSSGFSPPLGDALALSRADVSWLSLPTLLRYEDRSSMAESVESRLPFLDRRLVEFGLALPTDWKVHGPWGKWILRKAMADLLPRQVVWSRVKRGYAADDAIWINRGAGRWLRDRIADGAGHLQGVDAQIALAPDRYSDRALRRQPQRMHEALALAWLVTWRAAEGGPLPCDPLA